MSVFSQNADDGRNVWGGLVSKHTFFRSIDLINESYTIGRAPNCNYSLQVPAEKEKILNFISYHHFEITRDLNEFHSPVYIQDLSRNGTFVNGTIVGRTKKRILAHGDIISILYPKMQAFCFRDHRNPLVIDLPEEISQKYFLSKKLGFGAFGRVYKVHEYRTCENFALKRIKKDTFMDRKADKSLNEANIMKSLAHPCIVKMHDFLDCAGSVYITLELMEGGELFTRIQRKLFLSEDNSKVFFYQMCHAIKYLHGRNIAHRDLKPENILLATSDENTLLKISDFGLSKLVKNNSVLRTLCGTPEYVAPEVLLANGESVYTEKVDIWSLGVVLFSMLSGSLPFADDYGSPATDQIKNGRFAFRSSNWRTVSATARRRISFCFYKFEDRVHDGC